MRPSARRWRRPGATAPGASTRAAHVERLERRLAETHGVAFAAVCSSGTLAVELALRALKVGPGDEVILAAYDYPGNFLAVHAVGARPVLVDVTPDDWNLDLHSLAEAIGPAVKAVIVSHLHGGLVPMRELTELTTARNVAVIEDAAQAPGATMQGRRAGTWGDVGVLSFGGSKLLTAGPRRRPADRPGRRASAAAAAPAPGRKCALSPLRTPGRRPGAAARPARRAQRPPPPGRRPAGRAPRATCRASASFGGAPTASRAITRSAFSTTPKRFGLTRAQFVAAVRAEGIALDEGFRALHVGRSPERFRRVESLAEAERAHAGAVVLHHPVLLGSDEEVEQVAAAVRKVHRWAERLAAP